MATHTTKHTLHFHKTLIIDIETVPLTGDWEGLGTRLQKQWLRKMQFMRLPPEELADPAQVYRERAGIFAEFGRIVCIGMGFLHEEEELVTVRLKSVADEDEGVLLTNFCKLLQAFENKHKDVILCGHNIKEFDLPYICRRLLVHGMNLPPCLQLSGLKPWQIVHQDTLELWRFGDYKHYTSLELMAAVLDVTTSKSDMDGSEVGKVYWQQKDVGRIASYCLQDVYTTTLVYLKLKGWKGELPQPVYID